MKFELSDDAIVTVAGVRMTACTLEDSLMHPPQDRLFSVKREEDPPRLTFTFYSSPEEAAKFFDGLPKVDEADLSRAEGEGMPPVR